MRSTTCGSKPSARTSSRSRPTPLISLSTPSETIAAVAVANDVGVRNARLAQALANFRERLVGFLLRRDRRDVDPVAAPNLAFGDALLRLIARAAQSCGRRRRLRELAKRADARAAGFDFGGAVSRRGFVAARGARIGIELRARRRVRGGVERGLPDFDWRGRFDVRRDPAAP
jgi:hypothetical protein